MTGLRIELVTDDWSSQIQDENGYSEIGGAGWIRMEMIRRILNERGHTCVIGRGVITWDGLIRVQDRDTGRVPEQPPDIIMMQRLMGKEVIPSMKAAQSCGIKIIQDVDDAHYAIPTDNAAFWGSHPKNNPDANRAIYHEVLKKSDHLVVSTPTLEQAYRGRSGRPTTLIRNTLDFRYWPEPDFDKIHRVDVPTYGWVGATPWRVRDLKLLGGILGPFAIRNGVKVHHSGSIIGGYQFNELTHLGPDVQYTQQPMAVMKDYPALFDPLQVSLVPLTLSEFNDAKSYLKGALESVACGLPYIASPTAEYRYAHEAYGVGRLALKPKEWLKHLGALLDPEVRIEEAKRQYDALKTYGDAQTAATAYEQMFTEVLAQPSMF